MSMALELTIFAGAFALAIGLIGSFIGTTNERNRELRAAHASRRYARQPWDTDRPNRGGNR